MPTGMPNSSALEALLKAYRNEIEWLLTRAEKYLEEEPETAAKYIHRANNLRSVLDAYERLNAKSS